jgi:hypothetical protein
MLSESVAFLIRDTTRSPMGDRDRSSVSIILPTREWGVACEQLSAQLKPGDELLVVCDTDSDPVVDRDPPDGVRILTAGQPTGCAAKANAVAYGMEQATNDRFVWSDDDYERGSDWLDRLVRMGEAHGPTAFEPLIISEGIHFKFVEPVLASGIVLYDLYRDGGSGGYPWGGGVTFTREDLQEPVGRLCDELRQSVSDDNALDNYLEDTYAPRDWDIRIPVEGGFEDTTQRLTRWMRADHVRHSITRNVLISLLLTGVSLLCPLIVAPLATAIAALSYRKLGYRRWTFLLAYPGVVVFPVILAFGLLFREFTWGSRRYRLNGLYDVEVRRTESTSDSDGLSQY